MTITINLWYIVGLYLLFGLYIEYIVIKSTIKFWKHNHPKDNRKKLIQITHCWLTYLFTIIWWLDIMYPVRKKWYKVTKKPGYND